MSTTDLTNLLGFTDRAHIPYPGAPRSQDFKEWFHFNVLNAKDGNFDLIFNFSLAGNVHRAAAAAADVIILCHLPSRGWFGAIDTYDGAAARIASDRLLIELGQNRIDFVEGVYRIAWESQDKLFALDVQLVPRAEPMLIWNDTPIGSGDLNWLIVPDLAATGRLTLAGETKVFDRVDSYHDHNWGRWKWGEDFGWDWGFATARRPVPEAPSITIVCARTTSRNGETTYERTLAVWRHSSLLKVFTRRQVRTRREGAFSKQVPRLPGAARLIKHGRVLTVPARYQISARDDRDWLDLDYEVEIAHQISIPTDFGFGLVELNETFGTIRAAGEIAGHPISFSARACFEFMG